MKKIEPPSKTRWAFTLVEIVIGTFIALMLVVIVSMLLVQFKRSYSKGEESSVGIQEGGLFLANLRSDFVNAVMDPSLPPERWKEAIRAEPETLAFQIYKDAEGKIEPVLYHLEKKADGMLSVSRTQGAGSSKLLVNQRIASLSWKVETEVFPGLASGVKQIWLSLDMTLGGQGKPGIKAKVVNLSTKCFPTRLNKQINSF